MAAVNCVLSEDQFLCSICLEVFTDPVTTPCGHSFCNICINKHWDNCDHCNCPVCKEEFSSRPKLRTNTFILEMVSEFKNKPQKEDTESLESDSTGAGDVLCDVCPEPKLKALKSCLVCQTSYCPNHLTPHNTVPRLKKHQLIAPVENLEERICPEHERLLDMFCRDHSQLICVQCSCSFHKSHNTVPLKEQCEEEQSELQQKIQERKEKIQELQRSVELSQENADREMKEGVEFFNDLMKLVQETLDQFKQSIEQKHQEIKEKAEELMKEVESEISALEQRRAQMEEIWKSDDHFHFVQTFTLDKPAPEMNDWTEVSVRAPSYEGRVAIAVSDLTNTSLTPKIKKLLDCELKHVKQHAVGVTLDPDTAHPNLVVSADHKRVIYTEQSKPLPDTTERFSSSLYVLGKQKFSSGKFYFEVQVKEKTDWGLGVATESVDRKGDTVGSLYTGYWDTYGGSNHQHPWPSPQRVGVFVDYEEGLVCFFDAETSAIFHSFTDCSFNESILPVLNPCNNTSGKNFAPLILTPVTD
uniref:E3 ubiquitin-protein ligase TRIM39-like n=1 Tax=Neogobius melanostomus TaxID=47308 RepID=A0A8C6UWA7_9GOBI